MKMNLWLALPAALTAFALSQPASAAVVTYTYTGKVDYGFDNAGLFGGGALTGADFTAIFYRDDALARPDDIFLGEVNSSVSGDDAFSPVRATLTIGAYTLDIGGLYGDQTQTDYDGYEGFGHTAVGANGSLTMGGGTLGTFAPTSLNYLPGPDYHSLPSLSLADMPGFDWSGAFTYIQSTDAAARGSILTSAIFNPTTLMVSPNPGGGVSAAPEPSAWALMILGFGGVGATLRRRRGLAFA